MVELHQTNFYSLVSSVNITFCQIISVCLFHFFFSDISPSNVTYTEEPTEYDVNNAGLQIDTVVIILWSTGGVLLLTLIILMACILRSHKKGRRPIRRLVIPEYLTFVG